MNPDGTDPSFEVLRDREWRIEDIVGRPILENAPAQFRIEADGRVSGRTGCNLFTGAVGVEGSSIRFEGIATTRSICPPAIMDQEHRLLQALEAAREFAIDGEGRLHLKGEYEPFLLRASPRPSR